MQRITMNIWLKHIFITHRAILIAIIINSMAIFNGFSQDRIELGGFVGTSYYLGDLNPGTQFRQPHLAYGGLGRYVFNDRFVLRGSVLTGRISGKYPQKNVKLNESSDLPYEFSRRVTDIAAMFEYNFMSYDHQYISKTVFSPYFTMGLATTAYQRHSNDGTSASEKSVFVLSLPFGAGVKYKLNSWVRVGAEWTFRKTFVDDLDLTDTNGSVDPSNPYGFGDINKNNNNDWYSFAGVYATFNLFKRKSTCKSGF